MKQIVLDTETTGLDPKQGHRIIEIGAIEMENRRLTGRQFHEYINPERLVDPEAMSVHGITDDFLADKPVFADIADDFLRFISGAELIIHNAPFDVGFIDHELALYKQSMGQLADHCTVFDTLEYARNKHRGQRNNLDALCRRYQIDNAHRTLHGALLDAEILADVYLVMTGGQTGLDFEQLTSGSSGAQSQSSSQVSKRSTVELPIISATAEETVAHHDYMAAIQQSTA